MRLNSRQEKGILTNDDLVQVVDRFLTEQGWKPSQERVVLNDLHQRFSKWMKDAQVPFAIQQRQLSKLLMERGFRAAYTNIKSEKGYRLRKIIFAEQKAPS